ncbi:MAG: methylated-DNA--[protein]-cysteine S-methyltransferase [Verrucomicrobia bacterium]|nr:MAG: methylated-DNA--[protein]-cysteine S-methyltransferase [Verrucomicrobiota bacterium]
MDLRAGTRFQHSVWRELQTLAAGQTRSYGQIAAARGRPKACRAVGSACAANPLPLLVPCHRVLASGGRLGGFSGGLDWKRHLLQAESMGGSTSQVATFQVASVRGLRHCQHV